MAPTLREWFRWQGEESDAFWSREIRPVIDGWQAKHGPVYLRATIVDQVWLCLDGWICPNGVPPDDQGSEPTIADAPAGFV